MRPNDKFKNLSPEFWANVKLLNQRLGYTRRKSKNNPNSGFIVPTIKQIVKVFKKEGLNISSLVQAKSLRNLDNKLWIICSTEVTY